MGSKGRVKGLLTKTKKFKGSEVELEYLLTGEENQETIMFVHGAGASLRQFTPQHVHFSDRYRVLSVSLRGHGGSGSPSVQSSDQYTLEKNRDDLLELLAHLELGKVHYVGNSAGGVVGFYLIDARPDLFRSLVTFGTTAELKYSRFLVKLIAGVDKLMLRINPRGYLRFVSKSVSKSEPVQREVYEQFLQSIPAVPHVRANLGNYSCLRVIENMHIPYLLIKGEGDSQINQALNSTLGAIAANSNAAVMELKDAGHMANMDRPEEFNRVVADFVATVCSSC
jgi:pimeloyl-ACP methyl ester carboxylesterase